MGFVRAFHPWNRYSMDKPLPAAVSATAAPLPPPKMPKIVSSPDYPDSLYTPTREQPQPKPQPKLETDSQFWLTDHEIQIISDVDYYSVDSAEPELSSKEFQMIIGGIIVTAVGLSLWVFASHLYG